jgi:hypothetical protein
MVYEEVIPKKTLHEAFSPAQSTVEKLARELIPSGQLECPGQVALCQVPKYTSVILVYCKLFRLLNIQPAKSTYHITWLAFCFETEDSLEKATLDRLK